MTRHDRQEVSILNKMNGRWQFTPEPRAVCFDQVWSSL